MLILEILKCGGSSPPCPKNVGAWLIKLGTCTSANKGLILELLAGLHKCYCMDLHENKQSVPVNGLCVS